MAGAARAAGPTTARRRPRRPSWLLVAGCWALLGPRGAGADGLLAEYFLPLATSCGSNGSIGVLDGLLPSITRRDTTVNYPERSSFGLERCAWEVLGGSTTFSCRGTTEALKYFAARWTGSLLVLSPGMYTFEIEADDGARLTMGYGICPGVSCGDKTAVLNTKVGELTKTGSGANSYAKECGQCRQGIYIDCWNTPEGCEPFSVWRLEGDGGAGASCGRPAATISGERFLSAGTHPVELQYFQRGGGARMILKYSGPDTGGSMQVIPTAFLLFPRGNNLRAEWFTLPSQPPISRLPPASLRGQLPPGAQLLLREDDVFDENGPGVSRFSTRVKDLNSPVMIRWMGLFNIIQGGEYVFRLESDDGSRVIIAARGAGGEQVLVSNDGLHEGAQSSSVTVAMLPGLHPIRVEYFSVPGVDFGYSSVPRPPGVRLFFKGVDTLRTEQLVTKDRLLSADAFCQMSSFDWSLGMYMSRDCNGACIDGEERMVGDKACDDGRNTFLGQRKKVTCAAYNMDNYDCDPPIPAPPQSNRPQYKCYVTCPSGNFRRRDCSLCQGAQRLAQNGNGPFCSQSGDGNLTYVRCCSAKLRGVEYWGEDCLAFGTTTRCNDTFADVLAALRGNTPALDWRAARPDGAVPAISGELMTDCEGDYCNEITAGVVLNSFTQLPTDRRVCPIQESPLNGTECFVGPWEVTYLRNPFAECQKGKYKWNFCRDRKSPDGRPFTKCCSFLYINGLGGGECRFTGIAEGTCERYIQLLKAEVSSNAYTSISSPTVLNECAGDLCNDPSDAAMGCPEKIDRDHPFTLRDRLNQPTNWDVIAKQGVAEHPSETNWPAIFIPVGGVIFLCVAGLLYRQATIKPEESIWHSRGAKVIGGTTFVEPEKDASDLNGPSFGLVKPRPFALRQIIEKDKVKVSALALPYESACQEAAMAAKAEHEAREAAIMGRPPPSLKDAKEAEGGAPSPPLQALTAAQFVALEGVDPPTAKTRQAAQVGTALALPGQVLQQLALQNDAAAAVATPETTELVIRAAPVELQEKLDQVFAPPDALVPVTTMAATQSPAADPGATPALGPGPFGGTRGRPAAAARLMRQGLGGVPRVAT